MNIKIRQAVISDYSNILNLILEVHKLHLNNRPDVYKDIDTPLSEEEFKNMLNCDNSKVFVAKNTETNELVAYSLTLINTTGEHPMLQPKTFAYIDSFCVKSDCKKKGIGQMLFQHILEFAKTKNASSVQLNVWEFNEDAIKFYEAMGMNTRNRRMELNI